MAVADSINTLYLSILGRPADAPGLANAVAAVGRGATLAQIAAGLASSPEGQAIIGDFYQVELGRAPDPGGLAGATDYLANGGTLSGLRSGLGTSAEAQSDLAAIYQGELGRAPDSGGLANFEQFLAAGGSLAEVRASVAASPESQYNLNSLYQTILDRMPDSGGLAYYTQLLANGGSPASIKAALISSPEVAGDISGAYQAQLGRPADAVEIAAGQSLLLSGASQAYLQQEYGQLAGNRVTTPINDRNVAAITPQSIAGPGTTLVYGIVVDDALITSQPETVSNGTISGFNPASDVIQLPVYQANPYFINGQLGPPGAIAIQVPVGQTGTYANVEVYEATQSGVPTTFISIAGPYVDSLAGGSIALVGVADTSLHASNFRIV